MPLPFPRQNANPSEVLRVAGVFLMAAVVFCLVLWRWRLRVDHEGIARRRLWRWYVWPWEAFQSGEIRHGRGLGSYRWSKAAWTWRGLLLEVLENEDRKTVHELIKRLWVRPPDPPLPEEVNFRVLRSKVRLRDDGLEVRRGRAERRYRWMDIERIVILRVEHDRPDFVRLKIDLAEKPLELFVHQGNPNWRGAEAEVISRWFTTYAPADRILEVALIGTAKSRDEAEYRLERARELASKCRHGKRVIAALSLVPFTFGFIRPMMFIMAAMYVPLFLAMAWMYHKRQKEFEAEEQENLAWLDEQ